MVLAHLSNFLHLAGPTKQWNGTMQALRGAGEIETSTWHNQSPIRPHDRARCASAVPEMQMQVANMNSKRRSHNITTNAGHPTETSAGFSVYSGGWPSNGNVKINRPQTAPSAPQAEENETEPHPVQAGDSVDTAQVHTTKTVHGHGTRSRVVLSDCFYNNYPVLFSG